MLCIRACFINLGTSRRTCHCTSDERSRGTRILFSYADVQIRCTLCLRETKKGQNAPLVNII